jgi:fermentation-respiration switch protein FrsA (DUF1100 family)
MNETIAKPTFSTRSWGAANSVETRHYILHRVQFVSNGLIVSGNLFVPTRLSQTEAIVIVGPVAFVKEQSPLQYASRLASAGFVTLIFDPRNHGESEGLPRRHENPAAKVEDISAAIDFLLGRGGAVAERISILGICQGVNWTIEAALVDPRISSICLIAGHYLTPAVARMYLGGENAVDVRIAKSVQATEAFAENGAVTYTPIVSTSFVAPEPDALLSAPFIQSFYAHWADRHPMLAHRGLWENRITAMSEHLIWGHRIDASVAQLRLPVLMLHADRAASGVEIPRQLFETIPSTRKALIWLGDQSQIQFYEDPITIDQVVAHVADFLNLGRAGTDELSSSIKK